MWAVFALLMGCQDYSIKEGPKVAPAPPPGDTINDFGDPPDWATCFQGWIGEYSNLTIDHPDVEPDLNATPSPDSIEGLDWWDDPSYQQFDASLEFGEGWLPVDEGLQGDPDYFAVRWIAWMRARNDMNLEFTFGAGGDAWLFIDGVEIARVRAEDGYDPQTYSVNLDGGQYPVEIRYAHRTGSSGFRFRPLGVTEEQLQLCYPEYAEDAE